MTRIGCVVLTAGRRPDDLRAAVDSLLAQRDVELDIVVVGNGCQPAGVPDGVRVVALPSDDGIPAGRNAGVPHVRGELLFFLDDDAAARIDALARVAAEFAADPALGMLQLRVEPLQPGGGRGRATGSRASGTATPHAAARSRSCGRARSRSRAACSSGPGVGRRSFASYTRASISAGA